MSSGTRPENEPLPSDTATPVRVAYLGVSRVATTAEAAEVELYGNLERPAVRLEGRIVDPICFRETMSALYAIVGSDYRYAPKDKTAYLAYRRMKSESQSMSIWQAQQAYFMWMLRNDPLAFCMLDPIVTVHPDQTFFEVFSRDEGTYACLAFKNEAFDTTGETKYGTTNIDFSQGMYDSVQLMRSYRATTISVGREAVAMATESAGKAGEVLEKKVVVPDSWTRGFLQVQSAATLPFETFRIAPIDLYNVLREMRMHADIKGKRRGLRIELIPGENPKLVLEPWEMVIPTNSGIYKGKAARVVRLYGRRRLLLLRRLLPMLESIDIDIVGSGLPSFWVMRAKDFTFTLGMSGFTNSNWSQALNFDLLLPRKTQDTKTVRKVVDYLEGVWKAPLSEIGEQTGLEGAALLETVQAGCQEGQLMYDIANRVYRLRPLTEKPLDLGKLQFRNDREKVAFDLLHRRNAVELVSENRIAGTGLELVGKVAVEEDRREYRPMMLLSADGGVSRVECTCTAFRKNGIKDGPCIHLIALRLAWGQLQIKRLAGTSGEEVSAIQTSTWSKRSETGEETYQLSLEKRKLKTRWGKTGEILRVSTLQFGSTEEAREAYRSRIGGLDARGFLDATAE